jgi:predicted MPP superfamily phosphohydrolase
VAVGAAGFRPAGEQSGEDARRQHGTTPAGTGRQWTRRQWLWRLGGGLAGGAGAAAGYGAGWEPFRPVVERVEVALPGLPRALDGLRIVHLSDLHVQPAFPPERLRPVVRRVNELAPDLVALTGDYINDHAPGRDDFMAACARELGALRRPPLGAWASFGNHDFPVPPADPPRDPWERAGITPLIDDASRLSVRGAPLWIVGLRSSLVRPTSPERVLNGLHGTRLLLWHEPDRAAESARAGAALQFSGHTHGGQVRLPFVGAPVLPPQGRLYPSGLFRVGPMALYVNRGVACSRPSCA